MRTLSRQVSAPPSRLIVSTSDARPRPPAAKATATAYPSADYSARGAGADQPLPATYSLSTFAGTPPTTA
jgi:hypothetical protein